MSDLLVFSDADVAQALDYKRLIPAIRAAMVAVSAGRFALPLRHIDRVGELGAIGMMPGGWPDQELAGVKLIAFPTQAGQASHGGVMLLFAGPHMMPAAIMPADLLTARRTAAASAVATDALARPDVRTLAILGTGTQAAAHIDALRHVRDFTRITIWGRDTDKAEALAASHPHAVACRSVAETACGADVVCTTTAASEPFLSADMLAAGAHINLVGASIATRREADDSVIARGRLFVDARVSALAQAGELQRRFGGERIEAEIGEVLAGKPGRSGADDITIYKSLGVAAQDLAAAWLLLAVAAEGSLGSRVPWQGLPPPPPTISHRPSAGQT